MELEQLAQQAIAIVKQAGELIRSIPRPHVYTKEGHANFVTEADMASQRFLIEHLSPLLPEAHFFAEEQEENKMAPGFNWVIDPIDGTTNFINQHRNYAVSVGCWQGDEPLFGLVLDVEADRLYHACAGQGAWCGKTPLAASRRKNVSELLLFTPDVLRTFLQPGPGRQDLLRLAQDVRAVRSIGSVALELCAVACGEADLCVATRSCPWDHNAARIILQEAGGAIASLNGAPLPLTEPGTVLAAGSPEALALVLKQYGME